MKLIRKITQYLLAQRRLGNRLSKDFSNKTCNKEKQTKPDYEGCRKKKRDPDPDLSMFEGGKPYKTCGPGYIIQYDKIPSTLLPDSAETKILRQIEADPSLKNYTHDPMPPFQSVEQRLIDLSDRKLHPFYKRYLSLPRDNETNPLKMGPKSESETKEEDARMDEYYCKNGPVLLDDLPRQLRISQALLERKSIYEDSKVVELPKQMLVRIVEIEKNRKGTLEKKAGLKSKAMGKGSEGCFKEPECKK